MRIFAMMVFLFSLVTSARAETTVIVDPTAIFEIPPLLCVYKVVHWDDPKGVLRSAVYFVSLETCNKIRVARGLPPIDPSKSKKKEPPIELPNKENKTTLVL